MLRILVIIIIFLSCVSDLQAQCFASAGNPVGGTANMGNMNKNTFRFSSFYRYSLSGKYFSGNNLYTGTDGILTHAFFNYIGCLAGYGLTDKLTIETEAGYFLNKTQVYKFENMERTGYGLSNAVISVKPRLYYNPDKRIEVSVSFGTNIPFSKSLQKQDGVTLPVDLQPSTGSFGLVFQSFFIKENSFQAYRLFLMNRIEKYFENDQNYTFGTLYSTSFYFSRHFIFEQWKLKDWTCIIQLKNQVKEKNFRDDQIVNASGNYLFFLVPQINLSVHEKWNISILYEIPVYQYYYEIQLANSMSLGISVIRDFSFDKKNKTG